MSVNIFEKYIDELTFLITNKSDGVSQNLYNSLNLALHVGDNVKDVIENRAIVCDKNELILENLIYMEQTHSNNVHIVKDSSINKIKDCDALITNIKNIPLMVMVADCIPILIYDYINKVISVVHAGRVGSYKEIVKNTINKMSIKYDSEPENILVYLGPSIHSCCYEVSKDLVDFTNDTFGMGYVLEKKDRFYLNLQKLNYDQLISVGVKEENIKMSKICSCCNEKFFSYRRDGVTGRFAGMMMLK